MKLTAFDIDSAIILQQRVPLEISEPSKIGWGASAATKELGLPRSTAAHEPSSEMLAAS
jgi:hypothetical protein